MPDKIRFEFCLNSNSNFQSAAAAAGRREPAADTGCARREREVQGQGGAGWTRRRKEGAGRMISRKINKCLHRSPLRRSYRVRVFPWTNPCCPYDIRACGAACS